MDNKTYPIDRTQWVTGSLTELVVGKVYAVCLRATEIDNPDAKMSVLELIDPVPETVGAYAMLEPLNAALSSSGHIADFYRVLHNDQTSLQWQCLTSGEIRNEIHVNSHEVVKHTNALH